jgi:hypothetical protein
MLFGVTIVVACARATNRAIDAIKYESADPRLRTAIRAAEYPPSGSPGSSEAHGSDRKHFLKESFAAKLDTHVETLEAKYQLSRLGERARVEPNLGEGLGWAFQSALQEAKRADFDWHETIDPKRTGGADDAPVGNVKVDTVVERDRLARDPPTPYAAPEFWT